MASGSKDRVVIVISAKFASRRFPGKPLEEIFGKLLIQHIYESAMPVRW